MKKHIPKNTPYCYEIIKFVNDKNIEEGVKLNLCDYWIVKYNKEYDDEMEYCEYLKKFLDIQDQVKDCEVK